MTQSKNGNPQIQSIDKNQQSTQVRGLFRNFFQYASQRSIQLSKSIFGDYKYQPRNKYPYQKKIKILSYLKTKYMTTVIEFSQKKKLKFIDYDPNFPDGVQRSLRDIILMGKTQVSALKDSIQRLELSKKQIKARLLNQAAYEFDRQRYCSILWGLIFGATVCLTIYKNGSITRQAALFLASGHLFGQFSYHMNLDRYFDAVYTIYQVEALKFILEQKKQKQKGNPIKTHFID